MYFAGNISVFLEIISLEKHRSQTINPLSSQSNNKHGTQFVLSEHVGEDVISAKTAVGD